MAINVHLKMLVTEKWRQISSMSIEKKEQCSKQSF